MPEDTPLTPEAELLEKTRRLVAMTSLPKDLGLGDRWAIVLADAPILPDSARRQYEAALEALRDLMPSEAFDFHHTGLTGPSRYLLVQAESRAMKRWLARPGNRPPGGAPGPARPPS